MGQAPMRFRERDTRFLAMFVSLLLPLRSLLGPETAKISRTAGALFVNAEMWRKLFVTAVHGGSHVSQ